MCPCFSCCLQLCATLQPWRLRPCHPRGQHGQQYRQPASQGQGVQPPPQPGAHSELTASAVGLATSHCDNSRKGGRCTGSGLLLSLSPDRLGGVSQPLSPARTPEPERPTGHLVCSSAPLSSAIETAACDPWRGWARRWFRSPPRTLLTLCIKAKELLSQRNKTIVFKFPQVAGGWGNKPNILTAKMEPGPHGVGQPSGASWALGLA
jgi:hypothetical protein